MSAPREIAILGFGYSGLMVAAHAVRAATAPLTLYLIAETLDGVGVAYGTRCAQHLLNVRAQGMSAWADAPEDFMQWLLQQNLPYGAEDFVPRMIYGDYLRSIWRSTQALALQKNIALKHVPSIAVAVNARPHGLAVVTARGDAIAADQVVLATGHAVKPMLQQLPAMVQDPWAQPLTDAAQWAAPVMLIGMGLTSVDMVLALREHGYRGEIIATSRRRVWPRAHAATRSVFHFNAEEIAAHKNLSSLVRFVRRQVVQHTQQGGDWRAVVDALRPHTRILWGRLSAPEQRRFLRYLLPYWSIHRHRMAPEIAARIEAEVAAGTVRVVAGENLTECIAQWQPSHILNGTGSQLDVRRSPQLLWQELLAAGLVEPHATGLGIATDRQCRAFGHAHPNLFAMGGLMTGQWLESTAVPELRVQAKLVGEAVSS